ncbi:MAG: hypothetical protein M0Q01_15275, partial [Syntrophales bacterium]|nr:hypothetical protein [Syntrophales bacterium]
MANKEATARIKINKLLEAAGWRFFPEGATPATRDPREAERRLLFDTYRYSLPEGVKEGYLINPTVVDARTEITTELLS